MKYVVTGAAGFIGSHLVEELLRQGHEVTAVDNLWTGTMQNLHEALLKVPENCRSRLKWMEVDVRTFCDYPPDSVVYHLAALGSVPRSLSNPLLTHQSNVEGFFQAINIARKCGVRSFVYASSSSVYGDQNSETQREPHLGRLLSPYAATKRMNECLAQSFQQAFGMHCVGLRFFNVYGPRQNIDGPYAAVIPKWIRQMREGEQVDIYGLGDQVRDFTYVWDVVRALILAQYTTDTMATLNPVFNVGTGHGTTLLELFDTLSVLTNYKQKATHIPERASDKKRSVASLSISNYGLEYKPKYNLTQGLQETLNYDPRRGCP